MWKKHRIIVLPTDIINQSSSDIYLDKKSGKYNFGFVKDKFNYNKQLFVLSDEEIKELP